MTSIEIYWQDLSKEKQNELLELFDGDNHNWDVFPLATQLLISRMKSR